MASITKEQVTFANWQTPPYSTWAFHHVSDLLSCDIIASAPDSKTTAVSSPLDLSEFSIADSDGKTYSLDEFHEATATDSYIVQRGGKILHEHYQSGNTQQSKHILMSATKSVVGLLLGIMANEGTLDVDAPVSTYFPPAAQTAYAETTLRHLIDMRAGPDVQMWDHGYRTSIRWQPKEQGKQVVADMETYFATLTASASPNGGPFRYASQHTDLLGIAMERASGSSVVQLLSEKLWKPMGAGSDALMTVDPNGSSRAAGGMCTTLRDLAALGELIVNGGYASQDMAGKPVVPSAWVEDILHNGDKEAWRQGAFRHLFAPLGLEASYRNGWYVVEHANGKYVLASGLYGQSLIIDSSSGLVVAKMSSQSMGSGAKAGILTFRAFQEIQRIVLKHDA